jgi:O-antigen/teichoic acid export membrane protein
MSDWRKKVVKDTAMLNVAALTAQAASILQSLIVMRLLEPRLYGIWLGLMIILTYGGLAHFGGEHGLELRLPYLKGRGQRARAGAMADSVFVAWTASTLVLAAGVAVFAFASRGLDPLVRQGLYAIALILPLNQQAAFYSRWQGAALTDFKLSSLISAVQSWISLLVVVPLVVALGVRGLMLGAALVALLAYLGWVRGSAYEFRGRWSSRLFWQAIRVGLPMTLVVLGGGLVQTVDRLVIVSLLGATSLGYYAVAGLGGGLVYGLLSQAGSAMSPHISEEMGRSGDSPMSLERFLVVPTIVFAYIAAFAIGLLIVVVPLIVSSFLPKYTPGLGAFLIYVPGFYFLGIILTANTILTLILINSRRQRIVLYVQGAAITLEAGLAIVLVKSGLGLEGAALASTLASAYYGMTILTLAAARVLPSRTERTNFLLGVLTPFLVVVPLMLAAQLLGRWAFPGSVVVRATLELVVLATIAASLYPVLDRVVPVLPVANQVRHSVRARLSTRR